MGFSVLAGLPLGEFADQVNTAWGGEWSLRLDPEGVTNLKTDFGFLLHGRESRGVCLEGVSCRVQVDLVTSNFILYGGAGPELKIPTSWGGPYLEGFAGFAVFMTSSWVDTDDDTDDQFTTNDLADPTFAWGLGGGLDWRLPTNDTPTWVRLGIRYRRHGVVEYLAPGSTLENSNGTATALPIRSEANMLSIQLGVVGRLPGKGEDSRPPCP
jgi:hypothetical protein